MTTKEKVLKVLKDSKPDIKNRYKVKKMGLFGSYVTGEYKKTSDIDILIDFEENADLFDLVGLSIYLEEKLKQKVDVVSKNALRDEIKENILLQVVYI